MEGNLTGRYRVRVGRGALQDARKWLPRIRDRMELRRHALRLRYWPNAPTDRESGAVLDMDWAWVRALSGRKVGELRIHDAIGGCDNLRVIFWVPGQDEDPPSIWVLSVLQKKSNEFTAAQVRNFDARRRLILERFYENG